jgi:hypothetical protein
VNVRAWIGSSLLAAIAVLIAFAPANSQTTTSAPVTVKWTLTPSIKLTLTPNYNIGFGTVLATFGTQPSPSPGSAATLDGGSVDFGNIIAGDSYLYKYAAHLHITSNDANGFTVYGEGAANFSDGGSNSMTLNQTLFWVPSVASGDANTGFSAGYAFNATGGAVSPAQPESVIAPTITYTTYPAPITSSTTPNGDIYQDYEMKVPATAASVNYYVWIVYTVVAK